MPHIATYSMRFKPGELLPLLLSRQDEVNCRFAKRHDVAYHVVDSIIVTPPLLVCMVFLPIYGI